MASYQRLETRFQEIAQLQEIQAITSWDEACMMPRGGGAGRSEAMATLGSLIHQRLADPEIGELLNRVRAEHPTLDDWQSANLVSIEQAYVQATAVPAELERATQLASLRCEQAWREARAANDWPAIRPLLEEVVNLTRQRADALSAAMGLSAYDALLDCYQSELRTADVEPLFDDLKTYLPPLLERVIERQPSVAPLPGPFPVEQQRVLCEAVMGVLGFDFERGRFDVSHHPFCGGVPDDTRITTRYDDGGFLESLMAICHETGHALYQQGLPASWRQQPVGAAMGAAVHESQSLLMELQVCRGREFISQIAPLIRQSFDIADSDTAWSTENLYRQATRVERGFIRVDADELSYPLHVILRFELERGLLEGKLPVAELPEAWDAAMQRYLGLSTDGNDANGCMQDVHWYAGLFGYFPTYTLGALGAAQWFSVARAADSEIMPGITEGNLIPLLSWLRTHIHGRGRQLTMQPLFEAVTGSRLATTSYKQHVEARYLD